MLTFLRYILKNLSNREKWEQPTYITLEYGMSNLCVILQTVAAFSDLQQWRMAS